MKSVRVVHALVFGAAIASTLKITSSEAEQLVAVIARPYHFGDPVAPMAAFAFVLSALLAPLMLSFLLRRKAVPLKLSAAVLLAFSLAWADRIISGPRERSPLEANDQLSTVARSFHGRLVETLQAKAELPREASELQPFLRSAISASGPAGQFSGRARFGRELGYQLTRVSDREEALAQLVPGQLLVWVSEDGVAFQIVPVGFDPNGKPRALVEQTLKGVFNPDGLGMP